MSKSPEEHFIINDFKDKYNIELIKIPETARRSPDFKGCFDKKLHFYMELKTIKEDEFTNGIRNDPVFNRISSKIHIAFKQLIEINPDHLYSNIILFYNYDNSIDETYLDNIITDMFFAYDGSSHPIYKQFTRRIKDERRLIDLFLWYQYEEKRMHFRFWNSAGDKYHDSLCECFGKKPYEVKNIVERYN